ncbi:hypothetical protein [Catenovulum sediminis]|uniref:Glycosyl transferase family 1 domain-containing protein n=1 Tax=Catenovulum sediminis TaxID=1740262 RepID=A0ABV1RCV2_9ALTE|nr:hypothetical protein [Catenovulum sediminis]
MLAIINKLKCYINKIFSYIFLLPIQYSKKKKRRSKFAHLIVQFIAVALNIKNREACLIYKKGIKSAVTFHYNYSYLANLSVNDIAKEISKVKIINEEYVRTAEVEKRPIILVSIKSGDFYRGFLRLAEITTLNKELNIIKVSGKSDNEDKLYAKLKRYCKRLNIIRFDDDIAKKCFYQLRKNNIAIFMNDMEVRVNKRVTVDFMGKDTHFQCGIAELAVITKSVVVPVVNYKDDKNQHTLKIEEPIDVELLQHEGMAGKVHYITQRLASDMQDWLRSYPEQIHYWDEIADTFYASKDRKVNDVIKY